mmetsp:Transcript_106358/g.317890  ORF Transcript_106358/g.317890 Transcript_106358/m.317890 type:complete len:224 (-) Transcript_106358:7-678(-)
MVLVQGVGGVHSRGLLQQGRDLTTVLGRGELERIREAHGPVHIAPHCEERGFCILQGLDGIGQAAECLGQVRGLGRVLCGILSALLCGACEEGLQLRVNYRPLLQLRGLLRLQCGLLLDGRRDGVDAVLPRDDARGLGRGLVLAEAGKLVIVGRLARALCLNLRFQVLQELDDLLHGGDLNCGHKCGRRECQDQAKWLLHCRGDTFTCSGARVGELTNELCSA